MKLTVSFGDKKLYLFDEKGNKKEDFPLKALKSKNYKILQTLFIPESTKLAVVQSDNVILVYTFGLNWGESKSINDKYELNKKPAKMILSKTNTKVIKFGSSNGEIRSCLLDDNNTINILHSYQ